MPNPFLVMATQNPIENEGVYPLPEAQVDRFMMKVLVGYPSVTEEFVVVERSLAPTAVIQKILEPSALAALQQEADQVYVDPSLIEYAVQLAHASRDPARVGQSDLARLRHLRRQPPLVDQPGPRGPRAGLHPGRSTSCRRTSSTSPSTCMRHRLVLSYEALSDDVTADLVLSKILANLPVPRPAGRGR